MKQVFIYATLFVGMISLQSCYNDSEEKLYGLTVVEEATWAADVEPIIAGSCAIPGCHANGTGLPDLSTYANVKTLVDDGAFHTRVVRDQDMPPSTPLTPEQLASIELWLTEGALEN